MAGNSEDNNPSLYLTLREQDQALSEADSDKIRKSMRMNLLKDFDPSQKSMDPSLDSSVFATNNANVEFESLSSGSNGG